MAALRVSSVPATAGRVADPTDAGADAGAILELRGTLVSEQRAMRAEVLDRVQSDPGSLVELITLRTEVVDRDRRIAALTVAVRTWRERAFAEATAHRRDLADAHDREREIVSLLHQQMQLADSATAELERLRGRRWWQRLRG